MPVTTRNTPRAWGNVGPAGRGSSGEGSGRNEQSRDEEIELTAEQLSAFGYTTEEFEDMGFSGEQLSAIKLIATNMNEKDGPSSPTQIRQMEFDEIFADPSQRIIPGYNNDKPISRLEVSFRMMLLELGLNRATAEELFRHGYSSLSDLEGLDSTGIKGIISSVNKYKHSRCPNPAEVFIGRNFAERLRIVVAWVEFMPTIGHVISPTMWSEIVEKWMKDRLKSIKEDDEIEAHNDLELPDPLTNMSGFRKFDDQLQEYLRHKQGVTKAPLLYLLREGSDVEVNDNHTGGSVGDGEDDMFPDWASYHIRCTVHEGSHYKKDNNTLWGILFRLVGSGPGWSYIESFGGKNGRRGDGREAYLALARQAYQVSNVRLICEQKRSFIKTSSFTGHSQRYTFEKHKQKWFEAKETLQRYGRVICEEEFVMDFCNSISDPRLDHGIAVVLSEGSPYYNNFEKTAAYLSQALGIKEMVANRRRSATRNVAALQGKDTQAKNGRGNTNNSNKSQRGNGKKATYTGPITAKYYDFATWKSMSKEQKDQVLRLKKERDDSKTQKRSVSASTTTKEASGTPAKKTKFAGDQFGSRAHKAKDGNDSE